MDTPSKIFESYLPTDKEKTLQYVSALTLATLLALVRRQISPKYEPSLKEVAT